MALVVSKLAIVITLVVAVKLIANPAGDPDSASVINDGAAAVGTLMTGFVCFLVAAVTPVVLYKLMPTVEGAMVGAGIAGGWTRGATTAAHTALMVKSLGATTAASAATDVTSPANTARQGAPSAGAGRRRAHRRYPARHARRPAARGRRASNRGHRRRPTRRAPPAANRHGRDRRDARTGAEPSVDVRHRDASATDGDGDDGDEPARES